MVTPCVGVWIETEKFYGLIGKTVSHPAWVCGLKPNPAKFLPNPNGSHPAWVCGLKRLIA